MDTWLPLFVIAVLALAGYAALLWLFPWWPCRRCGGRGKLRDPLRRKAFRTCPSCGGRGQKPRLGVRLLQAARARRMRAREADHKKADERTGR